MPLSSSACAAPVKNEEHENPGLRLSKGVGGGDEVIIRPNTAVPTVAAIALTGATLHPRGPENRSNPKPEHQQATRKSSLRYRVPDFDSGRELAKRTLR
jgi:hypothetical protein